MPPVPAFRSRVAVVGLGIALALGGVAACRCGEPDGATPAVAAPRGRILVFGIDAATPRLVEPWMEEGLLPNLQGLAREGAWGPLASHHPLLSPRIWTSIATGKAPKRHGIEYWVHRKGPRKRRLYRSTDRKGPAIWNLLSDRGLRVGVVNWLITYPPEKVDGALVSDFAIPGARLRRVRLGPGFGRGIRSRVLGRRDQRPESGRGLVAPRGWSDSSGAASNGISGA